MRNGEVTSNHVEYTVTKIADEVAQSVTQDCVQPPLHWTHLRPHLQDLKAWTWYRIRVASLLAKYSDVFVKSPDGLGEQPR